MESAATRLKRARIRAGYKSAQAAANRFGWVASTYRSHENGQTPLPVDCARRYAQAFKISPDWLLFNNNAVGLDRLLEGKSERLRRLARRLIEALLEDED
jgi:hypothetical protein